MRYFLDTEFIEKPCTIDLISIGIVAEDGRTFYAENAGHEVQYSNEWVLQNVYPNLRWLDKTVLKNGYQDVSTIRGVTEAFGLRRDIKEAILQFIGNDTPEFWAYYASYDWVVFCWLFGRMIDLPDMWPIFCRDLIQEIDRRDLRNDAPLRDGNTHNALDDARWNMKVWEWLQNV